MNLSGVFATQGADDLCDVIDRFKRDEFIDETLRLGVRQETFSSVMELRNSLSSRESGRLLSPFGTSHLAVRINFRSATPREHLHL